MTSPVALSVPAVSRKTMLPLRPDWTLEYSPDHSPASAAISIDAPDTGTGVAGVPPPHAHKDTADTIAIAMCRDMRTLL
jgi:hypothetical protein